MDNRTKVPEEIQIMRKYEAARVAVEQLRALPGVEEVLILSTRNHTEIYACPLPDGISKK